MLKRKPNPQDRRSFMISLTDYSKMLKEQLINISISYSQRVFDVISEAEFEQLKSIFSKISTVL